MTLPNGLYYLEASPATGYGGLYATENGVNENVTVAPHTPPFIERQVWLIQPVLGGEEGQYSITSHNPGSTFGESWYPKDGGKPIPDSHVISSKEAQYAWFISYSDIGVPDTITIRPPPTGLDGVTLYVGTNEEYRVIIKAVPVVPGAEAPYWKFKRAPPIN